VDHIPLCTRSRDWVDLTNFKIDKQLTNYEPYKMRGTKTTKKLPPSVLAKLKAQQDDMRRKQEETDRLIIEEARLKKEEEERITREAEAERIRLEKLKLKKKEKQKKSKLRAENKLYDSKRKRLTMVKPNQELERNSEIQDASDLIDDQKYIICVLGHVNVGKTKLLDILCNSNTQEECNITQEIRAVIGQGRFIFIDTPGHQLFDHLRTKGGVFCDIALVVVDIFRGLENTTHECISLLKRAKIPFIIVLNKADRIYDWIPDSSEPIELKERNSSKFLSNYEKQDNQVKLHFRDLVNKIKLQFATCGLNTELFFHNEDDRLYFNMVPISCKTLEGIDDLIYILNMMCGKYKKSEKTNGLILHKQSINGLGTAIDYVLRSGTLKIDDLIPETMDIIKNLYLITDSLNMNMNGLKSVESIEGPNILRAIVALGSESYNFNTYGVYVQTANTCTLDSVIQFLTNKNIPICRGNIGNLNLKDLKKLLLLNSEHPKYNCIVCFNIDINSDLELFAKNNKIKMFAYKIIYDLEKEFIPYISSLDEQNKTTALPQCKMTILDKHIFRKADPIIIGVQIIAGTLVPSASIRVQVEPGKYIDLGIVTELRKDDHSIQMAQEGDKVSLMITGNNMVVGKHFKATDFLEV
jgi:small GTP-binding protein